MPSNFEKLVRISRAAQSILRLFDDIDPSIRTTANSRPTVAEKKTVKRRSKKHPKGSSKSNPVA